MIVRFLPHNQEIEVEPGENLLRAATEAGVYVQASCGGEGVCGKCRVTIEKGEVDGPCPASLAEEDFRRGVRLACQTRILGDLEVRIPVEAFLDQKTLLRGRGRVSAGRKLSHQTLESAVLGECFTPTSAKRFLEIGPPSIQENQADLDRVLLALKRQGGIEEISVDPRILKTLPKVLRQDGWRATATLRHNRSGSFPGECREKGLRRVQLIQVEAGDTTREHYSLAFDVGTTSIWGQLLDLNQRKVLAEASAYNGQVLHGDDVITRIVYSQKPGGLKKLQEVAVATMNLLIGELMTQARVRPEQITHMAAAGNTVMTHLLLGLDPKYIRESPYTPVASLVPPIQARELGLEVADHVSLYTFPQVASYVGGDIVAGVLGSGIYKQKPLTLYIDIGTNGEIVVGNCDWMVTAACSAGPAFEGGGIKHGLRAAPGAIEDFHLDSETFEPALLTIGMTKPRGICGSGLINIVAEFLEANVISPNGKFNTDLPTDRIRRGPDGMEYVLAYGAETLKGTDIVITEVDIDNLMRAKAAMYAGYATLLQAVGLSISDLERVVIAGAFGSFVDVERAVTIGLLPDLPRNRFLFVGNGSLLGARLLSYCHEMLDDAERIARIMTNVELSENPLFMDNYVAALFLPHTNADEFPEVSRRLEKRKNQATSAKSAGGITATKNV
ncbi:MAG: ASKHA domain-containing protein [Deltaproteobacteria bacterium]|nr:ASKHA domain-containing protein [Deltaproteobacteria bacterium]